MKHPGERRKHKRYPVNKCIFTLLNRQPNNPGSMHFMSMGEIAINMYKSKPSHIGKIVDISKEGLAFQYYHRHEKSKNPYEAAIICPDDLFSINKMQFDPISDIEIDNDNPLNPLTGRRYSLQFKKLDLDQRFMLDHVLEHYTNAGKE